MATSKDFILPDLGEGLTEAEIVNWLVAVGDTVVVDQPIIEVESAKSVVELPCPFAGVVEKLHAAVGDTIHSGQPVITVGVAGGSGDALADEGSDARADSVPGTALRGDPGAAAAGADAEVLAGYGAKAGDGRRPTRAGRFGRRGATVETAAAAPATSSSATPPAATGFAATAPSPSPMRRDDSTATGISLVVSPVVSPLVRKLAHEHGFAANTLRGTGTGGLVLRADVERVIAEGGPAGGSASADSPTPSVAPNPISSAEGDIRIPITGLRKIVADRMTASRRDVPEATIWLDVDATELLAAKEQLQKSTGDRWSLNALLARFVVAGLKQWPILNSSVDMAAGEIVQHSAINLGIAAQTARGLMVPIIHGAGEMTTEGLRDALTALVETAKTGNFPNDQLRGGTFTLNNYGGFGMDGSAPIINQPEVAMLGVGRILDRPWVVDGEIVVRKIMVLSMVFDHRVCDGDVPSEFMGFITKCIENPIALLGGL
ncbi:MAG: 2-oxo acid dehydrogenase subunit E2 [Cryobacterium sp.]|nr:2-oxo acid dehydrogenase subunit E2 [Cryobacterium sp.]